MDILVQFWNTENNRVDNRYLTSVFLGHATATDLRQAFKSALATMKLDLRKMIQVSMDGPAVNWKFLDELQEDIQESSANPGLINIGSCGLHVVNGAFKTGHAKSGWDICGALRAMYYLFKDSPARKADYTSITGSTKFPKKFCSVRWTENSDVATRGLEILDNLRKYIAEVKPAPTSQSFEKLKSCMQDKTLEAKMEFFRCVSDIVTPFLVKFQSPKPMVPFLFEELEVMVRTLMSRFIKDTALKNAESMFQLMKIDISTSGPSCKLSKHVDVGFGAQRALNKIKNNVSDLVLLVFKDDCRNFLSGVVSKLKERSPAKYSLTRSCSCLSPSLIVSSSALAQNWMQKLLEQLVSLNRINPYVADKAKRQFGVFLCSASIKQALKEFSPSEDRLDDFYMRLLCDPKYADLVRVVRLVLILSHGNAVVESGFSINNDMLITNLSKESVVCQRLVYDGLKACGGVLELNVDKPMIQHVRAARARYRDALDANARKADAETAQMSAKRKASQELKEIEAKKKKLEEDAAASCRQFDAHISELKKTIRKTVVVE